MIGNLRALWVICLLPTLGCEESTAKNAPLLIFEKDAGDEEEELLRIIRMTCPDEKKLDVADPDPVSAAKAMGLCPIGKGVISGAMPPDGGVDDAWGLIEARYTSPDGTGEMNPLSHGLLYGFGMNLPAQEGARMVALSSGVARDATDEGYASPSGAQMDKTGTAPPGFPVEFAGCEMASTSGQTQSETPDEMPVGPATQIYDGAALELKIRTPSRANAMRFNVNFYTYEFPDFVCSAYNDFFVVLQDPAPADALNGNIAFDKVGNPISVNNALVDVCAATTAGGKVFACRLGEKQLAGTGFEGRAATGWLEVVSPVDPNSELTLRFAVWDAGDSILDSTALIDNFRFDIVEAEGPSIGSIDFDGAVPPE